MKKLSILLFAIAISIGISSCSKDNDTTPQETTLNVSGKTFEVTYYYNRYGAPNDITTEEYTTKSELEANGKYYSFELRSDNNCYSGGNLAGTWSQEGSKLTMTATNSNVYKYTVTATQIEQNNTGIDEYENPYEEKLHLSVVQ